MKKLLLLTLLCGVTFIYALTPFRIYNPTIMQRAGLDSLSITINDSDSVDINTSKAFVSLNKPVKVNGDSLPTLTRVRQIIEDSTDNIYNRLDGSGKEYTDITSTASTTTGRYLGANALSMTTLANFNITEIDVTKANGVRVYGYYSVAVCGLAFKDISGNVIGTISIAPGSGYYTFERDVPTGAVIAVTSYSTSSSREFKQETYINSNFENKIELNTRNIILSENKLGSYNSNYTTDITSLLQTGGAWTSSGTFSTTGGASWAHIDNYNVSEIDGIYMFSRFVSSIGYVIWKFPDSTTLIVPGPYTNTIDRRYFKKPLGAVLAHISVIDYASYKEVLLSTVNTSTIAQNGISNKNLMKDIKDVIIVPVFGQSLSVGADAKPYISTYEKYGIGRNPNVGSLAYKKSLSDFIDLINMREYSGGETAQTGTVETFVELLAKENGILTNSSIWNNKIIVMASCGAGSNTIEMLLDDSLGTSAYQGLLNFVQFVKNYATTNNLTCYAPAWCWIQGESDQKYSTANYKEQLVSLADSMNIHVKAITGQTNDCVCISYQTCSQNIVNDGTVYNTPIFATPQMQVPTAQMELIRDSSLFIASTPVYCLEHLDDTIPIHLAAISEKILGAYQGIALKRLIYDNVKVKGVIPLSHVVNGNDITITYNVPCEPLVWDTLSVAFVSNYGFNVIKSTDADIISSVELKRDRVIIHCSESPIGTKLRYGFNGTILRAGRDLGSRGNLRDSQGNSLYIDISDKRINLHNWAYCFEYEL